ncbi:MAG: hypothetical protein ACP5DY_03680 [Thermovirgaceae bacterium]
MTERRWNEEEIRGYCGAGGHLDPEYDFEGLSLAYKEVQDAADCWGRRRG